MSQCSSKIWGLFLILLVMFSAGSFAASQVNTSLSSSETITPYQKSSSIINALVISDCAKWDHDLSLGYSSERHHCCASVCLLKMSCGQSLVVTHSLLSSLALINVDQAEKAIVRNQTLFRPPIV